MDTKRLYEILQETTTELRKGRIFEGTPALVEQAERGDDELKGGGMLEVYMMPHVSEAPSNIEKVDVVFEVIGVDRKIAEKRRADLVEILNDWPNPEELAGGPSYIAVGATIGSQSGAFQLFALGKVLGLWDLITPMTMGFEGDEARDLAGRGLIMTTGYRTAANASG